MNTPKENHMSFNIGLLIAGIFFAILAFFAKWYAYFPVDLAITKIIQNISFWGFHDLMLFMTNSGNTPNWIYLVFIAAMIAIFLKKIREAVVIVLSGYGAVVLSEFLKLIIARPRPDPYLINQIGRFIGHDSFPSGHVLFAIGFYGIIAYLLFVQPKMIALKKILIVPLIMVILLMGLSRIYVGAHWFSDTLGAYLIGFIWLSGMSAVYHRMNKG